MVKIMNNIKKAVFLEFMTIKNYFTLKNLMIILFSSLFAMFINQQPFMFMIMAFVMSDSYSAYVFVMNEMGMLETFFQILPLNRKEIVIGRYLFSTLIKVCFGLAGLVISLIFAGFIKLDVSILEMFMMFLGLLFIFVFVQNIKIPMFFKFGYSKSKIYSYLPYLVIVIISWGLKELSVLGFIIEIIGRNTILFFSGLFIFMVITIIISSNISLKIFKNKDLN